jgi:hypothetical protein
MVEAAENMKLERAGSVRKRDFCVVAKVEDADRNSGRLKLLGRASSGYAFCIIKSVECCLVCFVSRCVCLMTAC